MGVEAACVPLYACTLSEGSYIRNQHVSGSLTFLDSDSIPVLMQGELLMSSTALINVPKSITV